MASNPHPTSQPEAAQALYAILGVIGLSLTVVVLVLGAVAQGWFTHTQVHAEERRALERARAGIDATLARMANGRIDLLDLLQAAPLDGVLWESLDDPSFPVEAGSVVVYTLDLLDDVVSTPYNWVVIESTGVDGQVRRTLVQAMRATRTPRPTNAIFGEEGVLLAQQLKMQGGQIDRLDSSRFATLEQAWETPWGAYGRAELLGYGQMVLEAGGGVLEAHANVRSAFDRAWWPDAGSQPFASMALEGAPALNSSGEDFNPAWFNTVSSDPHSVHPGSRRYAAVIGENAEVHGSVQVSKGGLLVGPEATVWGDVSARGLGASTTPNDATGQVYLSIDGTARVNGAIETDGEPATEVSYQDSTTETLTAARDLALYHGAGTWEADGYRDGWHEVPPQLPYGNSGNPTRVEHNLALQHGPEGYDFEGSGSRIHGLSGQGFLDAEGRPIPQDDGDGAVEVGELSPGFTFSDEGDGYRFTVSRMHEQVVIHNDRPTTVYVAHAADWPFERLRFTGNAPVTIVSDGTIRARFGGPDSGLLSTTPEALDFDLALAAPEVVFDDRLQVGALTGQTRQLQVHAHRVRVEGTDSAVQVNGDAHLSVNVLQDGSAGAPEIDIQAGTLAVGGALRVEAHGTRSGATPLAGCLSVRAQGALQVGGPLTLDSDRMVLATGSAVELRSESFLFVGDAAFLEPASGLRNATLLLQLASDTGPFSQAGPDGLRSGEVQATFSQPSQLFVFAPHSQLYLGPDSQLLGAIVARTIGGKDAGQGPVSAGQPIVGLRFRQDDAAQSIGLAPNLDGEVTYMPYGPTDSPENNRQLFNEMLEAQGLAHLVGWGSEQP